MMKAMEIELGSVVRSKAGRDKGKLMAVIGIEENGLLLCDGKERRLEKPKLKNPRHVAVTGTVLDPGTMATDRSLKKALSAVEGAKSN